MGLSMRRFLLNILLLCGFAISTNAQQVTIGNNLLYDAWLTPNLRVGTRLSPHWSVGMTAGFRPWPTNDQTSRKWRHLLLSPDVRYWTDSVNVHHFFGANLIYSHYNVSEVRFPFGMYRSVRDERRQGDLGALGFFYGYSWPLGRYWNLEAVIGAAVGYTQFNRYECGHCGKKLGTTKKAFFMPQAALNIVYNLPGRPRLEPLPELLPEVESKPAFAPFMTPVTNLTYSAGRLHQDERPLHVHFPFDKSVLLPEFRNNAEVLRQILDVTAHALADTMTDVRTIQIVGLASIEGPVAYNQKLSLRRAEALKEYVRQHLQLADTLFEAVGGGEGWTDFRQQLQAEAEQNADHAAELRQALDLIASEKDPNRCEQKLKRLNGGRTWQYIKTHILRDQRNSGYMRVMYKYEPDKVAPLINRAIGLLRTDCSDCHHEALQHLLTIRHEERAQNALGVAYYLCGYTSEALDCFRRAAANGDRDAIDNLRQLEHP